MNTLSTGANNAPRDLVSWAPDGIRASHFAENNDPEKLRIAVAMGNEAIASIMRRIPVSSLDSRHYP